jgi:hypothetical protein
MGMNSPCPVGWAHRSLNKPTGRITEGLEKILEAFIAKELLPWVPTLPGPRKFSNFNGWPKSAEVESFQLSKQLENERS